MRVLVGDATGLVKTVGLSGVAGDKATDLQRWGEQAADERVCRMCWAACATQKQSEYAVARAGGRIDLCDTVSGERVGGWGGAGLVRGLDTVGSAQNNWRMVTCTAAGLVRTWRRPGTNAADSAAWEHQWEVCSGKPIGDAKAVTRMRLDQLDGGSLAVGGREKELQVWDIATQKATFTAKNVTNDMLNLRMPVWIADLCFEMGSRDKLLVATASREIRHYDLRTGQRRPVYAINVDEGQGYRPTVTDGVKMAVGVCHFSAFAMTGEHQAAAGDVVGGMLLFDLRKRQQCGAFCGGSGAVRDIVADERRGVVAACGADRNLRMYSSKNRKLLHKVYLKQQLNALLIEARAGDSSSDGGGTMTLEGSADRVSKKKGKSKAKTTTKPKVDEEDDPLAAMEAAFMGESLRGGDKAGNNDGSEEAGEHVEEASASVSASDEEGEDGKGEKEEDEEEDEEDDEEDDDDDEEDEEEDDEMNKAFLKMSEAGTADETDSESEESGQEIEQEDVAPQDEEDEQVDVAEEENDEAFMEWVLGGASAADEMQHVVPAGLIGKRRKQQRGPDNSKAAKQARGEWTAAKPTKAEKAKRRAKAAKTPRSVE